MLDRSPEELRRQALRVADLHQRLALVIDRLPREHASHGWRGLASEALHHTIETERARLQRELLRLEQVRESFELAALRATASLATGGAP